MNPVSTVITHTLKKIMHYHLLAGIGVCMVEGYTCVSVCVRACVRLFCDSVQR